MDDSALVSIGIMMFLAVVLVIALVALLLFHAWAQQSAPERVLVDTYKVATPRLSRAALRAHMQGHFVELGFDARIHQSAVLAERERVLNVLNLGPTGAGKTSYFLSAFLWRDIAAPDISVVVFDATRTLTPSILALSAQYGRIPRIYPEAGFNPLGGLGSARERAAHFADLLAQTPEVSGGAADYYSQVEQRFVRAIVPLFERAYGGRPMILRELVELAVSAERRAALLEVAGVSPEAAEFHLQFDSWTQEEWRRNLSGLITFVDRLMIGPRAALYNQREALSLDEALERKDLIVIREGGERHSQDHTLGLLFMVALQRYAARRDPLTSTHLISVYLDEAHLYFNPNFPTFLATSRQKRFALQLGFQNFTQFHPFTKTVISNARTWLVHGGLEYEDARLISDNIGQRLHLDRSIQTFTATAGGRGGSVQTAASAGRQESRQERLIYDYLLHPHEIQGLSADTLLALTVEDREMAALRLLHKPAPLTLSVRRYLEPSVPDYAPPALWEEMAAKHTRTPPPTSASTSASTSADHEARQDEPHQQPQQKEHEEQWDQSARRAQHERRRPETPPETPGKVSGQAPGAQRAKPAQAPSQGKKSALKPPAKPPHTTPGAPHGPPEGASPDW